MMTTINQKFQFDPSKNRLKNLETTEEMHLEPRIATLLSLLLTNQRTLVSRGEAIEKIWQNYAGADEGLTQAISFLRKILDDKKKTIIKTIPKKGYVLEATIEKEAVTTCIEKATQSPVSATQRKHFALLVGIAASMLLILGSTFWFSHQNPESPSFFSYQNHQRGAEIASPNYQHPRAEEPVAGAIELNVGAESPIPLK
jgi:DNA-binding winged helix-turn-helix (wHTH) protein